MQHVSDFQLLALDAVKHMEARADEVTPESCFKLLSRAPAQGKSYEAIRSFSDTAEGSISSIGIVDGD
jgi:hypothetical protein